MLTLLVVVLVLGVFCAGLVNPTVLFWQSTTSLTLVALLSCTLLALVGRSRKAFALGFTVTGWIYFMLVFNHIVLPDKDCLPTTLALQEVAHAFHGDFMDVEAPAGVVRPLRISTMDDTDENYYRFEQIGHCLFTLIFATIGGLAATWLQRPRKKKPEAQP